MSDLSLLSRLPPLPHACAPAQQVGFIHDVHDYTEIYFDVSHLPPPGRVLALELTTHSL